MAAASLSLPMRLAGFMVRQAGNKVRTFRTRPFATVAASKAGRGTQIERAPTLQTTVEPGEEGPIAAMALK